MKWNVCLLGTAALLLAGTSACKDREACERSRMKMQHTWADLKNTAAKQKVPSAFEDLTETEKAHRRELWEPVEGSAELLRSSFETKQITWNAAEKARQELNTQASALPNDGKPLAEGFARQLQAANAAYEEMQRDCR